MCQSGMCSTRQRLKSPDATSLGAARGERRLMRLRPGSPRVQDLRDAPPDGLAGALQILRLQVAVAEEDDRLVLPRFGVEAVLVVIVVRSLALGRLSPGPGDVAGGERVLEEVEREGFEGEDLAGLGGRWRRSGERGGPVHRGQMEDDVEGHRVGLDAAAQRLRRVGPGIGGAAREEEVRVARPGARRILLVGSLQAEIALHLNVAPLVLGPRVRDLLARALGDGRDGKDPVAVEDRREELRRRAGVIARDGGPGREIDARGLRSLGPGVEGFAEAGGTIRARLGPDRVEPGLAARVEHVDPAGRDRAMLGIDPGPGGRRAGERRAHPGRCPEGSAHRPGLSPDRCRERASR